MSNDHAHPIFAGILDSMMPPDDRDPGQQQMCQIVSPIEHLRANGLHAEAELLDDAGVALAALLTMPDYDGSIGTAIRRKNCKDAARRVLIQLGVTP